MKLQGRFAILAMVLLTAWNAAGAETPSLLGGKDSKKPIEINADALEVIQQDQKAVFTGNVVVIQGGMKLQADKMTVFYSSNPNQKADALAGGNSISKILVDGHVFLSTAEETARSSSGVYDVAGNQVHLTGNVVLTKGKNVLGGNKLDYDLTTGKSRMSGGANAEIGQKTSNGRVRGIFIPGEGKGK